MSRPRIVSSSGLGCREGGGRLKINLPGQLPSRAEKVLFLFPATQVQKGSQPPLPSP